MPRNRRIPSYRRHSTSGQAIVKLHGRVHYLGPYDSPESKALYDELIAEHLGKRKGDSARLVVEILAAFGRTPRCGTARAARAPSVPPSTIGR